MKWPALALGCAVAACAHRPLPMSRPAPLAVTSLPTRSVEIVPAKVREPRKCEHPRAPVLPDNAGAPTLAEAVDRLTVQVKLLTGHNRALTSALKACEAKP